MRDVHLLWLGVLLVGCGNGSDAGPTPSTEVSSVRVDRCPVFLDTSPWNQSIEEAPVRDDSDAIIDAIGRDLPLHPDFGTYHDDAPSGIPYTLVETHQERVPIDFTVFPEESDPGPYPIPPDAPIEGGAESDGDRHVLVVDRGECMLYELFRAYRVGAGERWEADSGAIWDLKVNHTRELGWTSADAAGLPILPGLVRFREAVEDGEIRHALRFTVPRSGVGYVPPASHFATTDNQPNLPVMGMRFRLKSDYDCAGFTAEVQAICRALKSYGMFLADHGGTWYISGQHDPRWDDDNLSQLDEITGDALEVVDTGKVQVY